MIKRQRRDGAEKLGHWGRAAGVLHVRPVQGRPAELPDGGMPRTSGNKDGNAGKFYAPECPVHHGYLGERKHHPLRVSLMRNSDHLAYTEQKAPCHCTVRQGIRAEEAAVSGGGIEGDHREPL